MTTDIHDTTPRPLEVLCLGLPRTGTASMHAALTTLGYVNVHHGLAYLQCNKTWPLFSAAADATFPFLSSSPSPSSSSQKKKWTNSRSDWDLIFSPCSAVTDVASVFAPQLLAAYPEAKVILVERSDPKKWWGSLEKEVIYPLWRSPWGGFLVSYVEPLIGSHVGPAGRKCILGMLGTGDWRGINEEMAVEAYERHYEGVRRILREEVEVGGKENRLLDFDMRDGWGPLCEFLGKEVPVSEEGGMVEFPHVNDAEAMRRKVKESQREQVGMLIKGLGPWVVGILGVAAGVVVWRRGGALR